MHKAFIASGNLLAIAFVVGLTMAASSAHATGSLTAVQRFSDGTVNVDMEDYTDGPKVVALIGMKGNGISISFAFDIAEWPKLRKLWNDARALTGPNYATAGSMREVGSSAQCVITFAGGPAVRITIVDPTEGALVYTVQPGDQAAFASALEQTGDAATKVN
jgi:hypothetical protein